MEVPDSDEALGNSLSTGYEPDRARGSSLRNDPQVLWAVSDDYYLSWIVSGNRVLQLRDEGIYVSPVLHSGSEDFVSSNAAGSAEKTESNEAAKVGLSDGIPTGLPLQR